MGILNLTPDSFSDGGSYRDVDAAVAQAKAMLDQGATIIDVGGESTRPGAQPVGAQEQMARVLPVIERLHTALPQAWISIDTTRGAVAAAALDAGACMINDISAGRHDQAMFELATQRRVPIVLMHMQGEPGTMQHDPKYDDVVAEVESFLLERAGAAEQAGVGRANILLDPGIGFGKSTEHNLTLLAALPWLSALGYPLLLGASRKRFLAPDLPPRERLGGTIATTVLAALAGVALVRVHDVAANQQALEQVRGWQMAECGGQMADGG
ncbi:MAG: dihydropteroate synthase [Phycisphaeraceae bacterium]|nr:dihydropteroate synthase [Phycisphaeraceae bacterium]